MDKSKILLADDDRLILTLLGKGLTDAGYAVLSAADGEAAVAQGCAHRPDLAVLDIRMPGVFGIEVARRLREQAAVPSLFLSAYADKELVELALAEGALGYLVKPVSVTQLIPAVETALLRASEISELRRDASTLTSAISSNREISVAIGIYMERHGTSHGQTVEILRRVARSQQRRLLEVAREITAGRHRRDGLIERIAPGQGDC